jgi:hypothetical protein
MSQSDVLIVNSCIEPQRVFGIAITDREARLRQLLCALVGWIRYTKVPTIVLGDNSLREYDFTCIAGFAKEHGKAFEALHLPPDPLTERLGKGHGEGSTIRHILAHSKYIEKDTSFYKITGNSFVANFDEIAAREADRPLVFGCEATPLFSLTNLKYIATESFRNTRRHYGRRGWLCFLLKPVFLRTHFYKCNVPIYKKLLINAYTKVYDSQGYCLEHAFYDSLRFRARWDAFSIKPTIIGISGSTGTWHDREYSEGIKGTAQVFFEKMK